MRSTFIRTIFYIGVCTFVSCREDTLARVGSFDSMGTRIIVQPEAAIPLVQESFSSVDAHMSEWKKDSALSAVNASAGIEPVQCSQEVCEAVQQAIEIAQLTNGAFDPTWACLWELWDFKAAKLPDETEVTKRLPLVNWEQVEIVDTTIFLQEEGMMLGLGGIAKGIALNQSRDALLQNGIVNFMLIAGGQVTVYGDSRKIGIRKPDGLPNEFVGTVELKDASISTSGDYEKFFEIDGKRYHHIIDPRTGYPANNAVRSASVISTDAALADALSTALCVTGVVDGLRLIEDLEGVEALCIEEDGNIVKSSGFHLE